MTFGRFDVTFRDSVAPNTDPASSAVTWRCGKCMSHVGSDGIAVEPRHCSGG
jgi:hypothetical protein